MKIALFLLFITKILFAIEDDAFQVRTPAINQIFEQPIVSIVVEVKDNLIDKIIIKNDVNNSISIATNEKRTDYCELISLHLGKNVIDVEGYKDGTLIVSLHRELFLKSKVEQDYRYPPKEYRHSYFHNEKNEKICAKCHDMSVNEVPGIAFEDVTRSNCYECHKKINSKNHAHAPSINWLCTSCHNSKVGVYNRADLNKSKFTFEDPVQPKCLSCHEKVEEIVKTKRFSHEPAASGKCNKCHNPHSSNNEFYLRKPVRELCTGCHKDKASGMHIVKTFGRIMHPTQGVKDPSRKGKNLNCVSCHNPHASNSESLLQSDSLYELCKRCHKK